VRLFGLIKKKFVTVHGNMNIKFVHDNTIILSHISHPWSDSTTHIVKKIVLFESCVTRVSFLHETVKFRSVYRQRFWVLCNEVRNRYRTKRKICKSMSIGLFITESEITGVN